jgi:hypothetical protein
MKPRRRTEFRHRSQHRLQTGRKNTGGALARFRDAQSVGEVVRAVRCINRRVRRDRREAVDAAREAYLRSLLK